MKTASLHLLIFLFIGNQLFAQVPNSGFENWDTTTQHIYESELLNIYNVPDPVMGAISNWNFSSEFGLCRTTDAYDGAYALILHNWYAYVKSTIWTTSELTSRPNYLNGYYKYFGEDSFGQAPHGLAQIVILDSMGDTIAHANHSFDTVSVYSPFEIAIDYTSINEADSLILTFTNSNLSCGTNLICDLLYLDKLSISQNSILNTQLLDENSFRIYPNPTSNKVYISNVTERDVIRLFTADGKLLLITSKPSIDISSLEPGLYFIELVKTDGSSSRNKLFKI